MQGVKEDMLNLLTTLVTNLLTTITKILVNKKRIFKAVVNLRKIVHIHTHSH